MKTDSLRSILVVRRDNIGDLACTTPFLHILRQALPGAHLAVLVNSYNGAVLDGNPDIDEVFAYDKLKHRNGFAGRLAAVGDRLRLIAKMRSCRFDLAILAKPSFDPHGLRMARMAGAQRVLGFAPNRGENAAGLSDTVTPSTEGMHEVEAVALLAGALGIAAAPGALRLFPEAKRSASFAGQLAVRSPGKRWLALHISARETSRQWPLAKFVALIEQFADIEEIGFALFWSPGAADNRMHPGDDEKAAALVARFPGNKVVALPTHSLEELIAGIAACDFFLGSDGGAMHVAAGLGRPIVALFENSQAKRTHWYPWQVPHRLLQPESFAVEDIAVAQVVQAVHEIINNNHKRASQPVTDSVA